MRVRDSGGKKDEISTLVDIIKSMAASASIPTLFMSSPVFCNRILDNAKLSSPANGKRLPLFIRFASKKKKLNLVDQILDYIEGGPKLRKWYGAPDLIEKDGDKLEENEAPEEEDIRDAVLVTDGDNEIGQMIILSLIVKRVRVKTMVKDKRAAMEAFGTYVESIAGDTKDKALVKKASTGVRVIISPVLSILLFLNRKDLYQILTIGKAYSMSSCYLRSSTGIQAVMTGNARKVAEQDEITAKASGIPYTIIRTGILVNTPGGQQGFSFVRGAAGNGRLSKEDAAFVCVEALDNVPQKGLTFEVVNGDEKVSDWKVCFQTLLERYADAE